MTSALCSVWVNHDDVSGCDNLFRSVVDSLCRSESNSSAWSKISLHDNESRFENSVEVLTDTTYEFFTEGAFLPVSLEIKLETFAFQAFVFGMLTLVFMLVVWIPIANAGFIAGYLVDELLETGHEVVGVDNFSNWPVPVQRLPRLGGLEDARHRERRRRVGRLPHRCRDAGARTADWSGFTGKIRFRRDAGGKEEPVDVEDWARFLGIDDSAE